MEAKQEPTRRNKQAGELTTCKGRLSPDSSPARKSHTTPQFALDLGLRKEKVPGLCLVLIVASNMLNVYP